MKHDLRHEMFIITKSALAIYLFNNVEEVLGIRIEIVKTSTAKTSSPKNFFP